MDVASRRARASEAGGGDGEGGKERGRAKGMVAQLQFPASAKEKRFASVGKLQPIPSLALMPVPS